MNTPILDIAKSGLCIGCGLCESIAGKDTLEIRMTAKGVERPVALKELSEDTLTQINTVCPALQIHGLSHEWLSDEATMDDLWGQHFQIIRGFSSDPEVRFKGSTGGVLSALAIYLLESNQVEFVAHIKKDDVKPLRNKAHLSYSRSDVIVAMGSRYAPAAPLVDFMGLLEKEKPFAFIGKPCDISAIRNLSKIDTRVDKYCKFLLTLVCGGASTLQKTWDVLDQFGVKEEEVADLRYRGFGNPGLTRVETHEGKVHELSYLKMWREELGWNIQSRCKVCPDAIGESADIAVLDVWLGGSPSGEDDGFNGIIPRTKRGKALLDAALNAGCLSQDEVLTARDLDDFQPHQVRKKQAVWARLEGLKEASKVSPKVTGLRIEKLAEQQPKADILAEKSGMIQRVKAGKFEDIL